MPKLSPAQRLLVRRRTRKPDVDPSETGSELNIIPFLDIVVNLILFLLVTTTAVLAITQVEAQLPSARPQGGGCNDCTEELGLTVTVGTEGIVVAGSGGVLAPGCEALGQGMTIPRGLDGHDFQALTACATRVKAEHPEAHQVILSADPTVPYEDFVAAMDALRGDSGTELFPDVLFAAAIR